MSDTKTDPQTAQAASNTVEVQGPDQADQAPSGPPKAQELPAFMSQEFRGKVEAMLAGNAKPANADGEWALGELRGVAVERDMIVKSLKELSEQRATLEQQIASRQAEFQRIDGHMTALVKVLHRAETK